MPLFDNAADLIRTNLGRIKNKSRVHVVPIGTLTAEQLSAINAVRLADDLTPIVEDVLFVGGHVYKSRIVGDGYTIEDVVDQISSAMDSEAVVIVTDYMTAMQNPNARPDRYGNMVKDRAVFECTARHPLPELISVSPKGDSIASIKQKSRQ